MINDIPSEMLRGHIDTIILLCLLDSDKHTAQIKEEIEQRAGGEFELKQGTFYSCLQRIVKQGYVTEYRTSNTPDGVRRKFYQLTEKGKVYIDENKDKWEYSRQVINTLILTPENEKAAQQSPTDGAQTGEKVIDEDAPPEETLNEFLSHIASETEESRFVSDQPEKVVEEQKPVEKQEKKHHENQQSKDNYDLFTYIDNTQSDIFPENADEEKSVEIQIAEEQIKQEEKQRQEQLDADRAQDKSFETVEEKPVFVVSKAEERVLEPEKTPDAPPKTEAEAPRRFVQTEPGRSDDLYNSEAVATTDYKSVLSRIFNTQDEAKEEKSPRQADYTEGFDINSFFASGETIDERTEKVEKTRSDKRKRSPARSERKTREKERTREVERTADRPAEYTTVRHAYYDFSDIQSMADSEGFKVRISSSEKTKDLGRILINKLVFHSLAIFFLIILAETLILYFTTANAAGLNFMPFGIFLGVMAILPIASAIIFFINPNKRVPRIATFRSALELLAIIMLNLILIEIVCLVLTNVNFADQHAVFRFIIYPTFFIINLPIYLFIKYLKLDKDKYYE